MRTCVTRLTVRGYELDSFGHVNNAVYLQYSETAVWNFMKQSGLLDCVNEAGLFPVVMESTLRYVHELKMLDEVRIESKFSCTASKLTVEHHIYNDETNRLSCKIKAKICLVTRDRIIHDIPDEVVNYLERETNDPETN